ncbi:hypothetical protein ACVI1I_006504 [Bradyrhizobium sp. USDA 4459]
MTPHVPIEWRRPQDGKDGSCHRRLSIARQPSVKANCNSYILAKLPGPLGWEATGCNPLHSRSTATASDYRLAAIIHLASPHAQAT